MPGKSAKHTRLLIGYHDLTLMSKQADTSIDADREDVTTFGMDGKASLALDPAMTISVNGFYVDPAAGLETQLQTMLATGALLVAHYGSNQAGSPAYVITDASAANFAVAAPVPGVMTVTGTSAPSAPNRGVVIDWGAVTATGDQTGADLGASGAGDYDLILLVHSISGSATDAVLSVDDSADNVTFANVATFAAFSAVGQETISAETLRRYVRVGVDDLGGATSISYSVIAVPV